MPKLPCVFPLLLVALLSSSAACDKEKEQAPPAKPSAAAAPSAPAPEAPASAPAATASAPAPKVDCPEGSSGDGTFDKPCEGKGTARMMEVAWTGKMDDKGPSFRVKNISKTDILYGKLAVYFYDKAGKQLEAKAAPGGEKDAKHPIQWCSGVRIFEGPMKAGEKAVITFSCVKKDSVPEGATAIEGELQMVGFTDAEGKKTHYYWRNKDLTPEARPKGKK